jgi:hypothetical protein
MPVDSAAGHEQINHEQNSCFVLTRALCRRDPVEELPATHLSVVGIARRDRMAAVYGLLEIHQLDDWKRLVGDDKWKPGYSAGFPPARSR